MRHVLNKLSVILCGFFLIVSACSLSPSRLKTIYDKDDRQSAASTDGASSVVSWVPSVALLTRSFRALQSDDGRIAIKSETAGKMLALCKEEPFREESMVGDCTGFLVSDTLLVTAGHCIPDDTDCSKRNFVFSHTRGGETVFPSRDVYSCKKTAARIGKDNGDLVLVELDRPVVSPAGTRRFSLLQANPSGGNGSLNATSLLTLGHPLGISMKRAPLESELSRSNEFYFQAQIDVAGGASGSPLFDPESGRVEGVLVHGAEDFEWDAAAGCARSSVCRGNSCSGETFASAQALRNLLNAAPSGRVGM